MRSSYACYLRLQRRSFSRLRTRHGFFLHRAGDLGQGSILFEENLSEGIGILTLSNPRHSNAISGKMMVLQHALHFITHLMELH